MINKLLGATAFVAVASSPVLAANVTLNFGSLSIGGFGPCVSDCIIGAGGLLSIADGVSAEGYSASNDSSFLTQKPASDGFAETGIGQSNSGKFSTDPNHEIAVKHFVVIDNVGAELLGFEPQSFTIGSLQAGEKGIIYGYTGPDGSPDLIPGDLTPLAVFTGGLTATFDVSGLSFDKYVFGSLKATGLTASNIVVTSEVLAAPNGIPELPTWVMGMAGFGLLGLVGLRRKDVARCAL